MVLGVAVFFPYLSVLTVEAPEAGDGLLAKVYAWSGATSRAQFLLMASAALAGIVKLRARRGQSQDARIDKGVIDHDIGAVERMQGQGGEEAGVARPRSDQPNTARREIR